MTAVEWLENEYNTKGKLTPVDFFQAKEMEKQEKIDFAEAFYDSLFQDAESYYNYLEANL